MLTILMLISHMLSDFIFQTNRMVEEKSDMKIKGYIKHALVLGVTSLPILLFIQFSCFVTVGLRIISVILIHLALDYGKEKLNLVLDKVKEKLYLALDKEIDESNFTLDKEKEISDKKLSIKVAIRHCSLILFIIDQILHIVTIVVFTNGLVLDFNFINEYIVNSVFINGGISYQNLKIIFIIGYIAFSGAYLIPLLFDIIYAKVDDYNKILNDKLKKGLSDTEHGFIDEVKTGKWIGILERILILVFLYTNQLASIGFIIAMKSLARFKMMDNKIFSEYYLLGTFISMVYAFAGFAVFSAIL